MTARILIIDNEHDFREMLKLELTYHGFQIDILSEDNINQLFTENSVIHNYSLILIGLNCEEALDSAISKIREINKNVWIKALSNNVTLKHKLDAYKSGADDYLCKGIAVEELIAKVNVIIRRESEKNSQSVLEYSDLKMNLISREVTRNNRELDLRSKEFDLLHVFLKHPEEILSREFIFNEVWGFDFLGDSNVIEVYIRYLRSKLGKPALIKTKRGEGYILISEEALIRKAKMPSVL